MISSQAALEKKLGIDLQAICQVMESQSDAMEQNNTMTETVFEALSDTGLFHLMAPKAFGGIEAEPSDIIDLGEMFGYHSGSGGWAFSQNTGVMAYSAYLSPECGQKVASTKAASGVFAPLGTAEKNGGSYEVAGHYQYGSGSLHAEYIGCGALEMNDGELCDFDDAGNPPVVCFFVPTAGVEFKGNWDVMGLQGTGSVDYEVPLQSVEAGMTFSLFTKEAVTGGPLYGIGPIGLASIGACGWALGVATRALDEAFKVVEAGRTRMGMAALKDQQVFQRESGRQIAALKAARLLVHDSYNQSFSYAKETGQGITNELHAELKIAGTHLFNTARQVTTFAFETAGSQGFRNPSRIQQCFRDIFTGGLHIAFDERYFEDASKLRMGMDTQIV